MSTSDPRTRDGMARRDVLAEALALGSVAFVLALPLWGLLRFQGPPMEEGFMLVFPELVLDGQVPNRDFLHLYGPGSLWVLAGWYRLFGVTLEVQRVFAFVQLAGFAGAVYLLARPWGRTLAAPAAAIAAVVMIAASRLTALAWVGGLACALLALWCLLTSARVGGRLARQWAFAGGAFASLALLFRPDLVVGMTLGAFAVVGILGATRLRAALGGLGLAVGGYLVHLLKAGPVAAVEGLVIEPVLDLRPGRALPVPPPGDRYDGWNQGFPDLDPPPWVDTVFAGPMQLRIWFFFLLANVLVVAAVGWWRVRERPRSLRARTLLAVGLVSVGIAPQALQRADSTHLGWAGALPLAFLAVALAEILRRPVRRTAPRHVFAAGAVVLAVFVLFPNFTLRTYTEHVGHTFDRRRFVWEIERGARRFYYGREDTAVDLRRALVDVANCARPGDRLLVANQDLALTPYNDAFLYFLLPDLVPATHYIEMDPGVANAPDSGLADDVASADLAILTTVYLNWTEPNDSTERGSEEPNRVLERDFVRIARYETGIELWLRADHAAIRPGCAADPPDAR